MKNIKFRAWDKTINYMDYRVRVSHFKGSIEVLDSWSTWRELKKDEYELMQYTGLKDIKGVEIYEGDMLKCTSRIYTNLGATGTGEYEETIKQVIWKDDSWGTRVISSNLTSKGAEKSGLGISAKYAEVIGNVWEDGDLIDSE